METQTNTIDWLNEESKTLNTQTNFDGERLPALKLQEGKITSIEIDFSKPFNKWSDDKATKAIIPLTCLGQKMVWWVNVKNPVYRQLIEKGKKGQTAFKVLQTGSLANTKYNIVED